MNMVSTPGLATAFPTPIATTTLRTSKATLHPRHSCFKSLITTSLRALQSHAPGFSQVSELPDITWDNVGFNNPMTTDYMFTMKCSEDGYFCDGGLQRFGKIELNPAACVLNYGQGVIEELKAYKKLDNSIVLFRPEENGLRMRMGAERMCMPAPTVEQFMEAVKLTVLANRRWVPPPNKGFLHIKPVLMGNGPVLSVKPAPEFTFLIYATSMGNNFKEGLQPINLVVENKIHRAVPGGVGSVNAIGNYAPVLKAQVEAKANGFCDVLYLDSVHKKYVEQTSTANIFLVKDKIISTPALEGTVLPGVTRKSIIEIAQSQGYQVEERPVSIEELLEADEVFCTRNAVCLSPIGSITYMGKRVSYQETGLGGVSEQLYQALSNIQMGLAEDNRGWTVTLK
ncbi:PREDICTED: branched-chain-amino-acid aminotransferase 5, chloroplastic-like [Fragaria vesca subsp. vesca]|uniref:branched-chain-amino-acid aminotransferase 5, chloroplastic-like n=1 Tax=Fragaria vesca subsp. vesca TaxID=101020 RepID=UPI0002C32EEC|nr:PREDICTED: branched-chain-amino-acid aminotransferase 5, chloroplastic-like [Fragaria vesca subsp. vesca]XP_011458885.1 PREDICTED: branched-chain-amino-acid aminotransferase 5, chloroplastic-like [Fragaria vesca subsp. vesca]XP_011458886.1 PREDICTED: branched-chain-amino-acid aminotransferase 5, chloroplastic-like [Fragaria vesca subsp. vesca]